MVLKKCDVYFVSNMDFETASKTFMKPYKDMQSALEDAIRKMGKTAKIIVMPHAGSTLPYLEQLEV